MANPFYSVIVPVYKVKEYLDQCVQGVLEQTFHDYELILVDDGSPDNCGIMCDSYAEKDSRVRVVHKKNGGLSSARNAGLEIAQGEYVIFLDSDDFWDDKDALNNIRKNVVETAADLLVFPAKRYYEADGKYTFITNVDVDRNKIIQKDTIQAVTYMIENNIYRAAAWNKVVKRKVIENNAMRFKEGYLSEDMDWCGDLLIYCRQFDYYNNAMYCYRQQRAGSITSERTEKLVSDKLFMCQKGLKQAEGMADKKKSFLLASYYAYEYAVTLGVSGGVRDQRILGQMKALRPLLQYDLCRKVKMVRTLMKLCGYSLARKVLCLFVAIKK